MSVYIPYMFFIFLVMLAAVQDIAYLKIPNAVILTLAVGFLPCALAAGLPWTVIGTNFLVGFGAFFIGLILFAFKLAGGGDGKLIAASALWFGWNMSLVQFLFYTAIFGGGLAVFVLFVRQTPAPHFLAKQDWFLRLQEPGGGLPYAVAVALGSLFALPNSPFYS